MYPVFLNEIYLSIIWMHHSKAPGTIGRKELMEMYHEELN